MAQIDYFVDDEDIKGADDTQGFLFTVPSDGNVRGTIKDDKYRATWVQKFVVETSKVYEGSSKDKNGVEYPATVFELDLQVPSDAIRPTTGETDPNAGRRLRVWLRLCPAAKGSPQHPKYKANNFNLAKLLGILRSAWGTEVLPHGTRPNLGEFFGGDPAAVVGKTIVANLQQDLYNGKPQDQIDSLVPLELQGA
jgi:hypothetical protein